MRAYVSYILELCMMFSFKNITRNFPSTKKFGMTEIDREKKFEKVSQRMDITSVKNFRGKIKIQRIYHSVFAQKENLTAATIIDKKITWIIFVAERKIRQATGSAAQLSQD